VFERLEVSAVDEVLDALRALAGADLHPLPGPELLQRAATLVAARNIIDAELARTIRRGELAQAAESDGLKGMAPWLRGHTRLSPTAAARDTANRWHTYRPDGSEIHVLHPVEHDPPTTRAG
jgi:hypothetical protein